MAYALSTSYDGKKMPLVCCDPDCAFSRMFIRDGVIYVPRGFDAFISRNDPIFEVPGWNMLVVNAVPAWREPIPGWNEHKEKLTDFNGLAAAGFPFWATGSTAQMYDELEKEYPWIGRNIHRIFRRPKDHSAVSGYELVTRYMAATSMANGQISSPGSVDLDIHQRNCYGISTMYSTVINGSSMIGGPWTTLGAYAAFLHISSTAVQQQINAVIGHKHNGRVSPNVYNEVYKLEIKVDSVPDSDVSQEIVTMGEEEQYDAFYRHFSSGSTTENGVSIEKIRELLSLLNGGPEDEEEDKKEDEESDIGFSSDIDDFINDILK